MTISSSSNQKHGYNASTSYNYQAMPLLRLDEVMRLPADETLITRKGFVPVKGGQVGLV
ncbi:type IV secretory system conjugative DNA transfer family protein [Legionella spiritensis]|uniref:type IV secretory system conjugative DNA transfer family protein n=1 Tax=Legionella spiritensis TaxID=452 RepID=UPI000B1F13DF